MNAADNVAYDNHERVEFCRDEATGLNAIIAIHSTALGPGAGGVRQWHYASEADALYDVLRLSQGMSYKNAMAGLRFGGGKAVIIEDAGFAPSDALYERFGDFVEAQGGQYITAEDVGMSPQIMQTIATRTGYVTGLPVSGGKAGGDPSPKTALGVFGGIQAAVRFKLGRDDLNGVTVAVQGIGNVGYNLCRLLHDAGAVLTVGDVDAAKVEHAVSEFGASAAPAEEVLFRDVDVVSPCALGALFTEESIPKLRTQIVAGGANNQLETRDDGLRLADAGVLYAPDYVINAGGIINVACEYEKTVGDDEVLVLVAKIGPRLTGIFEASARSGRPTNDIADEQARRIISGGVS